MTAPSRTPLKLVSDLSPGNLHEASGLARVGPDKSDIGPHRQDTASHHPAGHEGGIEARGCETVRRLSEYIGDISTLLAKSGLPADRQRDTPIHPARPLQTHGPEITACPRFNLDGSTFLWLPYGRDLVYVPTDGIWRIVAERDYVRLYTADRSYLLRSTLTALEERLCCRKFLRVHRSIMVALSDVIALRQTGRGAWSVVHRDESVSSIGRSYLGSVRAALGIDPADFTGSAGTEGADR